MVAFERGFKSWSEKISLQLRKDLLLSKVSPLQPAKLAEYLDVALRTPETLPQLGKEASEVLMEAENANWSAVTVSLDGRDMIVYNPRHSVGRQSSDIMHELSHILIGHRPATVVLGSETPLGIRSYDQAQEDEANWLAGCLLLPRPVLLHISQNARLTAEAPARFGVSEELLRYRINISGVAVQLRRRRGSK